MSPRVYKNIEETQIGHVIVTCEKVGIVCGNLGAELLDYIGTLEQRNYSGDLFIDLKEVQEACSSCAATLIHLQKVMQSQGRDLLIDGAGEGVRNIVSVNKLENVLHILNPQLA